MTPIVMLKTNPTPELITKILTRAAADGADAVVIHLPKTSEDEICFLCLLVHESSPRLDAQERLPFLFHPEIYPEPYETSFTNRSKSTRNRRSTEKCRSHGAAPTYRS